MLRYATGNLPIIYHIIFTIGVFLASRTPLPPTASIVYYLLVEAVVGAGFKGKSTACANLFRTTENRKSLFEAFSPPIDCKSYSLMAYYYYHWSFCEKSTCFPIIFLPIVIPGAQQRSNCARQKSDEKDRQTFREL